MMLDFEAYLVLMSAMVGFMGFFALFVVGAVKTPFLTFFRAFIFGRPIVNIKRKDNQQEFVLGDYGAGIVKTNKYGYYVVDPESVSREKKSGANVMHASDGVGLTLSEKMLRIIQRLKEDYGIKDYADVIRVIDLWRRCDHCGYEGIVNAIDKEKVEKDAKGNEQVIDKWTEYECPNKDCPSNQKGDIKPSFQKEPFIVNSPLFKTYDVGGTIDPYFKHNFNPDRGEVIIKREVRSEMEKEKSNPIKWIGIAIAIFIVFFGAALAYMIITQHLPTPVIPTVANIAPPTEAGGLIG